MHETVQTNPDAGKAPPKAPANSPYKWVGDICELTGWSERTVHERARLGEIPHRRPAGGRRLLFLESEIRAYLDGASLEVFLLPKHGRVCRPVAKANS
jgi:predicted DNA-binding transcriptional regulator AlpA